MDVQVAAEDGPVEVRPGVVADAAGISRCQGACWREAYTAMLRPGFFDDCPDGIGTERWAQVLGTPGVDAAVALVEGEVVGFAGAGAPSDQGEPDGSRPPRDRQLHTIYLRAAWYGSGVADRLMAASVGPGPAHLWVLEDNPRARAFYARHGFEPDGARAVDRWTGLPEVRLVR